MKRQFIRLFLLILITLVVVAWITERFIEREQTKAPSIDVHHILTMYDQQLAKQSPVTFDGLSQVNKSDLAWPHDLIAKLALGKIVSLSDIDGNVFYYQQSSINQQLVLRLGPFVEPEDESALYLTLSLVFYSAFAALLFVWLWPIFKDVIQLIDATNVFSSKREPIKSKVKRTSIMYPLAASVESMSRQIFRFLTLQRFLASSVSHDIRTPLSRLGFIIAMLSKDNVEETKAKVEAELDEIDSLTDQFIELARLEENHHQLQLEHKTIAPWLAPLVEKFTQGSAVEMNLHIQPDAAATYDEHFLARAVQNLIANAVKYAEKQVLIDVSVGEEYMEIRVCDDGSGIKPEEKERLIGLYQRGKSSKNLGSGYGIGLAFANVIAAWHNGHVQINQSKRLKGAAVSLFLPKGNR